MQRSQLQTSVSSRVSTRSKVAIGSALGASALVLAYVLLVADPSSGVIETRQQRILLKPEQRKWTVEASADPYRIKKEVWEEQYGARVRQKDTLSPMAKKSADMVRLLGDAEDVSRRLHLLEAKGVKELSAYQDKLSTIDAQIKGLETRSE